MVSFQPGLQPNTQQAHDDLANLFSRNMTFNPELRNSTTKETPRQEPEVPAVTQPIIYSISQHYHHSAHVKPQTQEPTNGGQVQPQRHSSESPQSELSPNEVILRNYGIDPNVLTPSQMQLFRIADDTQKLRLIELWCICPPSKPEEVPALAWNSTSVDHEEQLARMRYERQHAVMSLDGTTVQAGNGTWSQQTGSESEPYMVSGYEDHTRTEFERQPTDNRSRYTYNPFGAALSGTYSRATDPVYQGPDYNLQQQQQLDMASQYGAYEQNRGRPAELDAMDVM